MNAIIYQSAAGTVLRKSARPGGALRGLRTYFFCVKITGTRPAVRAFEAYMHEAFAPGGPFAPGSITPPRIDPVQRL